MQEVSGSIPLTSTNFCLVALFKSVNVNSVPFV
jgi:hypothetical protein